MTTLELLWVPMLLLLELATASADRVLEEARRLGAFAELRIESDHEDLPRMLFARRTP